MRLKAGRLVPIWTLLEKTGREDNLVILTVPEPVRKS
jgi:hypothetical protein